MGANSVRPTQRPVNQLEPHRTTSHHTAPRHIEKSRRVVFHVRVCVYQKSGNQEFEEHFAMRYMIDWGFSITDQVKANKGQAPSPAPLSMPSRLARHTRHESHIFLCHF